MRERVLVIVNLIAKYILGANGEQISENELVAVLRSEGFDAEEIQDAFSWMEATALSPQRTSERAAFCTAMPSIRIFTPEECRLMGTEARGFLIRLRGMGLIDDAIEEELIERIVAAAEGPVTRQEMKNLTALALLTKSSDLRQREIGCMLAEDWAHIYH